MPDLSSSADLGSNWHAGVLNAGNKSFCSYRMGTGIPGYTGFVPVHENISVPVKCAPSLPSHHTGTRGDGGALKPVETTHKNDFSLTPAQFGAATAPNALWDIKGSRPVGDPPFIRRPVNDVEQPFIATASYGEYDRGLQAREYPANVTQLGQLRPPSTIGKTPTRDPLYMTETAEKGAQISRAYKPFTAPAKAQRQRANKDILSVKLHEPELQTNYRTDFGAFGQNPRERTAKTPQEVSLNATTAEQFQGTSKATYHPPGYSGFIPASGRNAHATVQGQMSSSRQPGKWELSTLFQYAYSLPGTASYRPRTTINDVGPIRDEALTTTGRFTTDGACHFKPGDLGLSMQTLAKTAPLRSVHGKRGQLKADLFTHESIAGSLSDNGQHDAETYYHRSRPFEGRSVSIIKEGHWAQAQY